LRISTRTTGVAFTWCACSGAAVEEAEELVVEGAVVARVAAVVVA
jgi:hypothetical protein